MSGFYNNWLKVQNPNSSNDSVQTRSGGFQSPFYFGGSQVPVNLGLTTVEGCSINKYNFVQSDQGKKIQNTLHNKASNVNIPRKLM